MNQKLFDTICNVKTKEDFLDFINDLGKDFKVNNDEWQNTSITAYLESLAACLEVDHNMWKEKEEYNNEKISWARVADLFLMGKYYE